MSYRFNDDEEDVPTPIYGSPFYQRLASSSIGPDVSRSVMQLLVPGLSRMPMPSGDPTVPFGVTQPTSAGRGASDASSSDAWSAPTAAAPHASALEGLCQALSIQPTAVDVAQAQTTTPTRPVNAAYPSAETLANIIYNETGSLRQHPSGPSLDNLHSTMAHALLNRIDQRTIGKVAPNVLSPDARTAIFKNREPDAVSAYDSALAAARAALGRDKALSLGRDSTVFYNNRPNADTSPNTRGALPRPFVATFGPYRNENPTREAPADSTYFAYFREPD